MQKFQGGPPRWAVHEGMMIKILDSLDQRATAGCQVFVPAMFPYPAAICDLVDMVLSCGIFGVAEGRAGVTVLINKQPKWNQSDLDSAPGSAAGLQSDGESTVLVLVIHPLVPCPFSLCRLSDGSIWSWTLQCNLQTLHLKAPLF